MYVKSETNTQREGCHGYSNSADRKDRNCRWTDVRRSFFCVFFKWADTLQGQRHVEIVQDRKECPVKVSWKCYQLCMAARLIFILFVSFSFFFFYYWKQDELITLLHIKLF